MTTDVAEVTTTETQVAPVEEATRAVENADAAPIETPEVVAPSAEENERLEARRQARKERETAAPEPRQRLQDNPDFLQRTAAEQRAYEEGHRTRQSKLDAEETALVQMLKAEGVTDDHAIVRQAKAAIKVAKDVLNEHHADGKSKAGFASRAEARQEFEDALTDAVMEIVPESRRPTHAKTLTDEWEKKGKALPFTDIIRLTAAEIYRDWKSPEEYQKGLDEEYLNGLRDGEKGRNTASSGQTVSGTAVSGTGDWAKDDAVLTDPNSTDSQRQAILKKRGLL